jgi:hypothetical protein
VTILVRQGGLFMATMTPNEIFERALELGTEAYQKQSRLKWGVSVCATPIQVGEGMILGINWGGGGPSDNYSYESQKSMPTQEEFQRDLENGDYRFLIRSKNYLMEYMKIDLESGKFNYTNLCLFRSPSQKDLSTEDYKSCSETFKFLVREISPLWILSFGTGNIDKLNALIPGFSPEIKSIGRAKGCSDRLLDKPFYCVPHPNAHLSKNDRDGIWKKVFPARSNQDPVA